MQRGDGDLFSSLKPQQCCIDEVFGAHHDACIQVLYRQSTDGPEVRGRSTRQHCLHPNTFVGQLMLKRLTEGQHKSLAGTVDAIQGLRGDGDDGRNVDDRSASTSHEARSRRIGQPHGHRGIQIDHAGHLFNVAVQQGRMCTHARVVDQQGDAGVRAQLLFHACQFIAVVQVGRQDFYRTAGASADAARQRVQLFAVAGDQDQVIATLSELFCI